MTWHIRKPAVASRLCLFTVFDRLSNLEKPDSRFLEGVPHHRSGLRHHYPEKWNGVGDDFSVAQHASDVGALIKKLNLGKVHLLGHSRGGPIALTVASQYPENILRLFLKTATSIQ